MSPSRAQTISLRNRKLPPTKEQKTDKPLDLVEGYIEGNDQTDGKGSKGIAKRKRTEEKRRATFYLTTDLYEEVKIHSIRARKDMSAIAQEAFALYLSRNS